MISTGALTFLVALSDGGLFSGDGVRGLDGAQAGDGACGLGGAASFPGGAGSFCSGASGDVVEPISGDVGSGIGDTEPASGVEPADCGIEPDSDDVGPGEGCGKSED